MPVTIDALRKDHANFGQLLGMLEAQVRLFHEGQDPNYDLMLDIIYYMTRYPDLFHHPREDRIFERVRKADAASRAIVDELTREHTVLRETGATLLENLEGIVGDQMLARKDVEAAAQTYVTYLRNHMVKEESELFARALKLLRAEDWSAIDSETPFHADPLFGESVHERYRTLRHHIVNEAAPG